MSLSHRHVQPSEVEPLISQSSGHDPKLFALKPAPMVSGHSVKSTIENYLHNIRYAKSVLARKQSKKLSDLVLKYGEEVRKLQEALGQGIITKEDSFACADGKMKARAQQMLRPASPASPAR